MPTNPTHLFNTHLPHFIPHPNPCIDNPPFILLSPVCFPTEDGLHGLDMCIGEWSRRGDQDTTDRPWYQRQSSHQGKYIYLLTLSDPTVAVGYYTLS